MFDLYASLIIRLPSGLDASTHSLSSSLFIGLPVSHCIFNFHNMTIHFKVFNDKPEIAESIQSVSSRRGMAQRRNARCGEGKGRLLRMDHGVKCAPNRSLA